MSGYGFLTRYYTKVLPVGRQDKTVDNFMTQHHNHLKFGMLTQLEVLFEYNLDLYLPEKIFYISFQKKPFIMYENASQLMSHFVTMVTQLTMMLLT